MDSNRRALYPAIGYMIKLNNRGTWKGAKLVLNLTSLLSGVFIVNFENILPLFLVFVLLTLNKCFLDDDAMAAVVIRYIFYLELDVCRSVIYGMK